MLDVDSLREVLRALAEVRDGPFQSLYVDLTYRFNGTIPKIEFRIYQVADSHEVLLVVRVSVVRSDGNDVDWSLSMQTSAGAMVITASVDILSERGYHQVFERSANTIDAQQAATLIHTFADEVCGQRRWIEYTNIE